jgi:hypothetical protein
MVDYTKLAPVLLQAIKEQQSQIESQKSEIQILREEMDQIKALLAGTGNQ